jgi:hypothetical protein
VDGYRGRLHPAAPYAGMTQTELLGFSEINDFYCKNGTTGLTWPLGLLPRCKKTIEGQLGFFALGNRRQLVAAAHHLRNHHDNNADRGARGRHQKGSPTRWRAPGSKNDAERGAG